MLNEHIYTDTEINVLLDMYYRDHPRPAPYPAIALAMGLPGHESGLDDLLWKVVSGYSGNQADGPRRKFIPSRHRAPRAGRKWYPREDTALRVALGGEGQRRQPPVDVAYIAAVLNRPVTEIGERWQHIHTDPLGRAGFGFGFGG